MRVVSYVRGLASILGCKVASLPMKYLGLPLVASIKAKPIWDGVVEKIEKRLARWKMMYLSRGGRITLIIFLIFLLIFYHCFLCLQGWLIELKGYFVFSYEDEVKFHLVSTRFALQFLAEGWSFAI